MLKQILIASVIMLFFIAPVSAHEGCKEDDHKKYSLLRNKNLPHLMPAVLKDMDKLKITEKQKIELENIVADVMEPFYSKSGEAMALEKQIAQDVLKNGKNKEEIMPMLNKLARLKQDVTEVHIGALNRIKRTLKEEQYRMLLDIISKGTGKCESDEKGENHAKNDQAGD